MHGFIKIVLDSIESYFKLS